MTRQAPRHARRTPKSIRFRDRTLFAGSFFTATLLQLVLIGAFARGQPLWVEAIVLAFFAVIGAILFELTLALSNFCADRPSPRHGGRTSLLVEARSVSRQLKATGSNGQAYIYTGLVCGAACAVVISGLLAHPTWI
jgi:hypothetical protein